ncbi:MAG: hypothetical protein MJ126_04400 [Lachnospiraceae bacterium]|nr:hypothetical protein [Lachnospiraceae bacterium]
MKRDLTGLMFGDCLVLEEVKKPDNISGHDWTTKWKCRCGCGEEMIKTSSRITNVENPMCRSCAGKFRWKDKWVDLTGKVFGELTVVKLVDAPETAKDKNSKYWECKCSCGNTTIVKTSNLNNGHCTRCWICARYKSNESKRVDYTGQSFGELTVLEMMYPNRDSDDKRTKCKCVCSCGNGIIRVVDSLFRAKNPSCGCKRHKSIVDACAIDINNKKFGRLLILETIYDFENHTKPRVKCLCDCGKEIILFKNDVLSGSTKSCGCLRKEINSTINEKDWTNVVSDAGVKLLSFAYQNDKGTRMWNCECPLCKNTFVALPAKVMSCHTTSCGCKIESSLERITESILVKYNIKYIKQYSFDDCVYKYKLKFDFAILDDNGKVIFIIENDGRQHYESVEFFGGQEGFESTQIRDEIKNKYCKSHNIPLLRFPYYLGKEEIEKEIINNLIVETAVG